MLWYKFFSNTGMNRLSLSRCLQLVLFLFFFFLGLHHARSFLVPLVFAGFLAMLLLPIARRLERSGWNKALATLAALLLLVLFFTGIFSLLAWQISDMARDAPRIEQNILQKSQQVRAWMASTLGIPEQKQEQMMQQQQSSSPGRISGLLTSGLASLGRFFTNALLTLIYIFLFMYYRAHLWKFLLQLVPDAKREETREVTNNARRVARKYISGLALMIGCLWIMYGIGFSIAGVKNALFFAVLCGLLEIVPFVGNITGTALTLFASLAQNGNTSVTIGILVTYAVVQFIQTYLIEPLVVGREVSINPLVTIMGIVFGEFIWGIPGMVLAIPVMGVIKIVFDHVPSLHPYSFLLSEEREEESGGFMEKIKGWFSKRK
jgi:predicted PurR-regulated permease PerM